MAKTCMAAGKAGAFESCLNFQKVQKNQKFIQKKVRAFSVAEVLITLSIIAIVALFTVPTLYKKYQEKITVVKLQKFYSTLNTAVSTAIKKNGNPKYWGTDNFDKESAQKLYKILIEPNFKILEDCEQSGTECLTQENYKQLDGSLYNAFGNMGQYYKVVLVDGAHVFVRGGEGMGGVFYDVNGKEPPNKIGVDLFAFPGRKNFLEPEGLSTKAKGCLDKTNGYSCAAWVVYKGNMDYLKCNDLSWDSKQKCSK